MIVRDMNVDHLDLTCNDVMNVDCAYLIFYSSMLVIVFTNGNSYGTENMQHIEDCSLVT